VANSRPRHRPGDFDWTDEAVADLKRRYALGHATTRIAFEMGCSRDGVVSKIARTDMPPRLSPPEPAPVVPLLPRIKVGSLMTLPPLAAAAPQGALDAPLERAATRGRSRCEFPLWSHTVRPTFAFCDAPRARGSYCEEHAALCCSATPTPIRIPRRI
jgi:hypothetical protein